MIVLVFVIYRKRCPVSEVKYIVPFVFPNKVADDKSNVFVIVKEIFLQQRYYIVLEDLGKIGYAPYADEIRMPNLMFSVQKECNPSVDSR